jgi:hypothetical protein
MQRSDGERRGTIPEGIARLAYEQYSFLYGTSQSFERMNERGGFGTLEIIGLLADLVERERSSRLSSQEAPKA